MRGPPPAGGARGPVNPNLVAVALIDALAGSAQPLDHVTLAHGHLEVENQALGKSSVYEDFSVAYDKGVDSATVAVSARGPAGPWSFSANAHAGPELRLTAEARDLSLDDILLLNARRPPFESDMPISFKFDASLTREGAMKSMQGGFGLGAGYFRLDDPDHEPFLVDEATGRFGWDADAGRFRLDGLEALAGASHFRINGWLGPPVGDDGAWRAHLQTNDFVFGPERPGDLPVPIDQATFDARFAPSQNRFVLDGFAVHGPRLQGEMKAEVAAQGDGASLKLEMQLGESGLAEVMRIWPSFINAEARVWCLEHVRAGDLASGTMKVEWNAAEFDDALHKRAVPADSVRADFAMRDAAVDLLPGVPSLTGLDAVGVLTGRVFEVTAKHGAMEFSAGRHMQASDVFFRIPDTRPAPVVASQAGAHVQGAADALAELLQRDAIKRYSGFTVDPANVRGQFQGQLTLDLGLGKTVRPEDQRFRVEGALSNFQLDKYVADERFEQGALDVVADSSSLRITGQGIVNGMPAKVDLSRGANDDGLLLMNLTLDDATRAKLGLNLGPPMTGVMSARLKAPLSKGAADVEVDLTKVEIASPEGAVLKAAGKPGKATFTLKTSADGIAVGALAVDAGAMFVRGSAQLSPDAAMQSVKLTQLRLSAADDLRLDLQGGPVMKATLRGSVFDARDVVKAFFSHDFRIHRAEGLRSRPQGRLRARRQRSVDFAIRTRAQPPRGRDPFAAGDGKLGQGVVSARRDEFGSMIVRAEDAGAFGKFLDFYTHLEGGSLELVLRDLPDGTHGTANLRAFTLRDPALKRMAAAAPASASVRAEVSAGAGAIEASTMRFDRMTANFARAGGRLDLQEAVVYNAQVGMTAQGFIDYAHDKVDLNGAFVPAYQLNSLVTGIPIVGVLLGGGKNEGIFAVNYRVTGPASAPTLTVNPLSGVTPGIFRKLFGVLDGTTPTPVPGSDAEPPGQ